ncbi:MAG: hypothetical protein IK118_03380 [Clostridia bacterium]|nr:hypothetical protein [Clostridia bacterium]
MKKTFICESITLLLTVSILFTVFSVPASANSGPRRWQGLTQSGATFTDENCPIEVVKEKLTLNIPDEPVPESTNTSYWADYANEVTAEYTFYNPTQDTITATLVFPCGALPDYARRRTDALSSEELTAYRDRYGTFLNGKAIATTIRYALDLGLDGFDVKDAMPGASGVLKEDKLLQPDTPVTTYVYRFDGIRDEQGMRTEAVLQTVGSNGRILCLDSGGLPEWFRDDEKVYFDVWSGDEVSLLVFGDPLPDSAQWMFFDVDEDNAPVSGSAELVRSESVRFMDFCLLAKGSYPDASDTDLFNATVDMVNSENVYGSFGDGAIMHAELTPDLMCWYEYEIALAPGETLTNTVRAPLYPEIDDSWRPRDCKYTYLLSPAAGWAKFGALEIEIDTPFYLSAESLKGFKKTENGYALTRAGLPEGELTFTLCKSRIPLPSPEQLPWLLFSLLGFGIPIAAAVVIIVVVVKHIKKKRREKGNASF